jgi:flavin reductase (DIM6/NTAB) family NADH-FMN oxidoreductase RutF
MSIKTINPKEVSTAKFHGYMLGAVAPRPIAFASTVDAEGNVNLSPFSFFNCFSANPPIMIFSPARRVRDNTTKHTLENVLVNEEVVINIVNHDMVEQMSLASTEYDAGVDEFIKSGLTPISSEVVKPPRVKESPAAFECKVIEVKPLGDQGGAGNLIICEVLLMHVDEDILDGTERIDPYKLDAVARMGGNWYCRAQGDAIFEIPKPITTKGIGVDEIPMNIRNSEVLTGNNLGRLGNIEAFPNPNDIKLFGNRVDVKDAKRAGTLHQLAQQFLDKGEVENAWKVLLA